MQLIHFRVSLLWICCNIKSTVSSRARNCRKQFLLMYCIYFNNTRVYEWVLIEYKCVHIQLYIAIYTQNRKYRRYAWDIKMRDCNSLSVTKFNRSITLGRDNKRNNCFLTMSLPPKCLTWARRTTEGTRVNNGARGCDIFSVIHLWRK